MAWVQLRNLFEGDKNYYGLIPDTIEGTVEKGKHFDLLEEEYRNKIEKKFIGKTFRAKELFDTELNSPEWGLSTNGKLMCCSGNLIEIEGKMFFPELFSLDISRWLREQPKEFLQKLADFAFVEWVRKEDDLDEKSKLPKDHLSSSKFGVKKRSLETQQEFFKNMEVKS